MAPLRLYYRLEIIRPLSRRTIQFMHIIWRTRLLSFLLWKRLLANMLWGCGTETQNCISAAGKQQGIAGKKPGIDYGPQRPTWSCYDSTFANEMRNAETFICYLWELRERKRARTRAKTREGRVLKWYVRRCDWFNECQCDRRGKWYLRDTGVSWNIFWDWRDWKRELMVLVMRIDFFKKALYLSFKSKQANEPTWKMSVITVLKIRDRLLEIKFQWCNANGSPVGPLALTKAFFGLHGSIRNCSQVLYFRLQPISRMKQRKEVDGKGYVALIGRVRWSHQSLCLKKLTKVAGWGLI